MELVKKDNLFDTRHSLVEETWLIHDNIVLKASLNTTFEEECCKLEMIIYEDIKDDT
jgi:hypothetical protein